MATPTLVQAVATGMSSFTHGYVFNYGSPNNDDCNTWNMSLPNNTLASNLLVVVILSTEPTAGAWGVTDNKSNTWTAGPTYTDTTNGNLISAFYCAGSTAGVNLLTFTLTSSGTAQGVCALFSEWYNVATSAALDGSNHNNGTSASWTAGSITPTVSGDLLLSFAEQVTAADPWNQTITAMTGGTWSLLQAQRQLGYASQFEVYNSTTAINPTITAGASTGFIALCMAFKSAAAGTAPTAVPRVVARHTFFVDSTSSVVEQVPCFGNLLVACWDGYADSTTSNTVSLADSHSNTWTSRGSSASPGSTPGTIQILDTDAATTTVGGTTTITITVSGNAAYECMLRVHDIQAPLSSGNFDSTAGAQTASGTQTIFGNLATVSITPTTSNGLVITAVQIGYGTLSGLVSPPAGSFSDISVIPVDTSWATTDSLDENNGWGHTYNTGVSPITYTWACNQYLTDAIGSWSSMAAAYKGAAVIIPEIAEYPFPGFPQTLLAM